MHEITNVLSACQSTAQKINNLIETNPINYFICMFGSIILDLLKFVIICEENLINMNETAGLEISITTIIILM